MLAHRGIEVSRETVRYWVNKFGCWHLDEAMAKIGGKRMVIWRAVDDEGEALDVLAQKRRNKTAALKLLKRLVKNQGVHPESIVTDRLASYGAAVRN